MSTQAAEIRAIADALHPESPAMGPVTEQLTRGGGAVEARLVTEGLWRAGKHLAPRPVRVTFGGYFSSGKSSLLNMLIGDPLLPTDDLPETGVPCLLRSGDADRVLVRTSDGVTEIPFRTEDISRYVSLLGAGGEYRDSIRAVQDVRVILRSRPIPADATWVDSPGVNDQQAITELAAGLARDGDVLVWVTKSGQSMGLVEQDFLAGHLAEAGPASVTFVLNVILDADTEAAWERFTGRREQYVRRITDNIQTDGVPAQVVCVSARAAASAGPGSGGAGFGAAEARALLAEISQQGAPRVVATRLFRATAELRRVVAELSTREAAEGQRVTAANAAAQAAADAEAARRKRDRARQHEEFLRAVRREVASVFAANSDLANGCASAVRAMTSGSLESPGYYGDRLGSKLVDAMGELAGDLTRAINRCARGHGHSELSGSGAIARLLSPGTVSISGSASGTGESVVGGATAGGVIGGIIGSLFFGIGAVPGAAIGAAIGGTAGGSSASTKQREAIAAQLAQAGRDATARMLGAEAQVAALAVRDCTQPAQPARKAPRADESRLKALRTARQRLTELGLRPLEAALASWQSKAGG
jgi:hypothetical protein